MRYLRLISGVGFWVKEEESKAIIEEVYKNGKETVIIQGNLIPANQIAGVFNENMGAEFEAKKRGLVLYKGEFYTKAELVGRTVLPTDSLGNIATEDTKMIENK
jgi:hypothetical protein